MARIEDYGHDLPTEKDAVKALADLIGPQMAEGLWTVDGRFRTPFFNGSVRMTVLAVDGGLVLHSPVALTDPDVEAICGIAPVAAILAPNTMHYQSLNAAAE